MVGGVIFRDLRREGDFAEVELWQNSQKSVRLLRGTSYRAKHTSSESLALLGGKLLATMYDCERVAGEGVLLGQEDVHDIKFQYLRWCSHGRTGRRMEKSILYCQWAGS